MTDKIYSVFGLRRPALVAYLEDDEVTLSNGATSGSSALGAQRRAQPW